MIRIGEVVLSDYLLLPGIKNLPSRAGSTRRTLGGRAVYRSISIAGGHILTLSDPGKFGLFTGGQIDLINGYRASGAFVEFTHHLGVWQVVVEAVAVEQAEDITDPTTDDRYIGTITMITKG